MRARDHIDIVAGGLLIAIGLVASLQASTSYNLGSVSHFGPGMFPTVLGYILAGIGVAILTPALFRSRAFPPPSYRQFFAVLFGILLFAVAIDAAGLVPAIFLVTIAAALADNKLGIMKTGVLAIALSVISVIVFKLGLGIPLQVFRWPF